MAEYHLALPDRPGTESEEPGALWFVGHATTLCSMEGITFLVDPVFVPAGALVRCGALQRSRRIVPPAVAFDQLPPFDVVLVTHDDEDHFDPIAREWIPRERPVITTVKAAGKLRKEGFARVFGLRPWDSVVVERGGTLARVSGVPARHGPSWLGLDGEVVGILLDVLHGDRYRNVYFSGDTLPCPELRETAKQRKIQTAVLYLGGERFLGTLRTLDVGRGIDVARWLDPQIIIPVHCADFSNGRTTAREFAERAARAGLVDRVVCLGHGEGIVLPFLEAGWNRDGSSSQRSSSSERYSAPSWSTSSAG